VGGIIFALLWLDEDEDEAEADAEAEAEGEAEELGEPEKVSPVPVGRISLLKAHPARAKVPAVRLPKRTVRRVNPFRSLAEKLACALGRKDIVSPENG
jgi:hypothetical protein